MVYTLADIRTAVLQRCDIENSSAQTTAEINRHINDASRYVHDFLIATMGEEYDNQSTTITITANTSSTSTPATGAFAGLIYRPISLTISFDDIVYPLSRYSIMDHVQSTLPASYGPGYLPQYRYIQNAQDASLIIQVSPPPDVDTDLTLHFHPRAPVYVDDTDEVWLPYPDLLIIEACIRVKMKEERDASLFLGEREAIKKRIEDWVGTIDRGNPPGTLYAPRGARASWRRQRLF